MSRFADPGGRVDGLAVLASRMQQLFIALKLTSRNALIDDMGANEGTSAIRRAALNPPTAT